MKWFEENYKIIDNVDDFKDFFKGYAKRFAFDVETTGLNVTTAQLIGMSFYDGKTSPVFVQLNFSHYFVGQVPDPTNKRKKLTLKVPYEKTDAINMHEILPDLREIFKGAEIIGANTKYDAKIMMKYGIHYKIVGDTMVASFLADSSTPNDLKSNARRYLGFDMVSYAETAGAKKVQGHLNIVWPEVDWKKYGRYGALDSYSTWFLHDVLLQEMHKAGKSRIASAPDADVLNCYYSVELPLIPIVADMEFSGVRIDKQLLKKIGRELDKEIAISEAKIYTEAGVKFNIGSSQQLGEILFTRLKIKAKKQTKAGKDSVDEDTLKELAFDGNKIADYLLKYRKLVKLRTTYTDAVIDQVDADGRLRGSFNQIGTATGRFSASSPNLQNIPTNKKFPIRDAFIPAPGMTIVGGDFSQLELRVMAHMSKDAALIEAYQNNEDIHQKTADGINKNNGLSISRSQGKTLNFSVLYGMSAPTLMYNINAQLRSSFHEGSISFEEMNSKLITKETAQAMIDGYYKTYKGFEDMGAKEVYKAERRGFASTLSGRVRQIPELKDRMTYGAGKRYTISTWIQGSAADIVKIAMVRAYYALKDAGIQFKPLLQVHDEWMLEVPIHQAKTAEKVLKASIEASIEGFAVPLIFDTGIYETWGEAKFGKRKKDNLALLKILEII